MKKDGREERLEIKVRLEKEERLGWLEKLARLERQEIQEQHEKK